MQFNLIGYKELTQTAWGRSQYNNDKMHFVFAEGIKCGKDCSLMFAHSNCLTIREDNLHLHATHHAQSVVFPGVDWIKFILKADMGERRKTLNIWLKRTWDRGGVEGTRLEAKDTKTYPRPKTALLRTGLF